MRRLAAGDWVVAVHAAGLVSPGLGKLSFRAASERERGEQRTERATLRWFEVRVGDAFERYLLTGELEG